MTKEYAARLIVFENLRATGCSEALARRVFDVPSDFIATAKGIIEKRMLPQLRGGGPPLYASLADESRATGKSFEQLLEEKNPERYKTLLKRQAADDYKRYLDVVAKRSVGPYVDKIHRRLAVSIAEQIALDEEYEKKWDAIRTNLRAAGAHSA